MHSILKGFLNPKAENYIFPAAEALEPDSGDFIDFFDTLTETQTVEEDFLEEPPKDVEEKLLEEPPKNAEELSPKPERDGPVQYAQLQAELILNQAREDAASILAHARAAAEEECEAIRSGARDEGYREGYAQGLSKAMDDAQRDRETTAARLEQDIQVFLQKASLARDEMLQDMQGEMLDLCIAVAEKIVRVSLRSSSEIIVRMIQTATERLKRKEWVHIYISGCDTRGIAQISPALTTALGALSQHIKIVPMGDDEGGTCIVETPDEIIDASVSTQLSNIRDVLTDHLGTLH